MRIQFDGDISDSFKVRYGVKQDCVLAFTRFAIYVASLFHHAFGGNKDGVYLRTRFNGSLFYLKRLKLKRLTTEVLIRELLFADDTAKPAHSEVTLRRLTDRLGEACDFRKLTVSV